MLPPGLSSPDTFVSGEPDGDRIRVRYYVDPQTNRIQARTWFGPRTLGPPGHAHGGGIAAVLDEAMGAAALYSGRIALAGRLSVEFHAPVPIGHTVTAEAWIERVDGSKVYTKSRLIDGREKIYASAEGLFVEIGYERLAALLDPL